MDPYLHRLQETIASSVHDIGHEDLVRHPEGKWSTAEILEHLYLTYTATVKGCERCLASSPSSTPRSFRKRLITFVVVGCGHMPNGRKASKQNSPRGLAADEVLAKIGPQVGILDEALARCEARYGSKTRFMDHPVLGPLSVPEWRKFHWVHGRHHVRQILRLRELWPK